VLAAAKYVARALSMPVLHQWYLAFLQSDPLLQACVDRDPRLRCGGHVSGRR